MGCSAWRLAFTSSSFRATRVVGSVIASNTDPSSRVRATNEYCYVCSLGYEMAMNALGDERQADRFVQTLRR